MQTWRYLPCLGDPTPAHFTMPEVEWHPPLPAHWVTTALGRHKIADWGVLVEAMVNQLDADRLRPLPPPATKYSGFEPTMSDSDRMLSHGITPEMHAAIVQACIWDELPAAGPHFAPPLPDLEPVAKARRRIAARALDAAALVLGGLLGWLVISIATHAK